MQAPAADFEPSINPCVRLKVNLKGLITKYWSVEANGQEQFRVNTSQEKVELRHTSGIFAFAVSNLSETKVTHPSLPLPHFNSSLLGSFTQIFGLKPRENQLLKASSLPKIFIDIEKPINIERANVNRIILSSPGIQDYGFVVRDVPGHYKWRAWQIYDCRTPSKPLIQFIWFGIIPGKTTIGGIELFAALPEAYVTSLLIVIMAYFNECQIVDNPRSNSRSLFSKGTSYIAPANPSEVKQQGYRFSFNSS